MRNLSGYDEWADLTAEMAALGAVKHYTPEVYIPQQGYYRDAQHQYTLAEDSSYIIATFGLLAEKTSPYWHTNLVASNLSDMLSPKTRAHVSNASLLRRSGDYLQKEGYPRDITAKTLCVYSHRLHATVARGGLEKMPTAGHIHYCADMVMLTGLTFEQQIDAARWAIDPAALGDLLSRGAPYMLAVEMFIGVPKAVKS